MFHKKLADLVFAEILFQRVGAANKERTKVEIVIVIVIESSNSNRPLARG